MSSYKTTGVILRRHDYGEADRIYTFLTREGKRSAVAKSVRKAGAKLASHLELFCDIELMVVGGRGKVGIITSARILRQFDMSSDYELLRRGFLFLETADKLTDTEDTADIYDLLLTGMEALAGCEPPLAELWFKLRLLQALGQMPRLDRDSNNAVLDAGKQYVFDAHQGVLRPVATGGNISGDAIKLWRLVQKHEPSALLKVGKAGVVAAESLELVDRFIEDQFGVRFKAAEL